MSPPSRLHPHQATNHRCFKISISQEDISNIATSKQMLFYIVITADAAMPDCTLAGWQGRPLLSLLALGGKSASDNGAKSKSQARHKRQGASHREEQRNCPYVVFLRHLPNKFTYNNFWYPFCLDYTVYESSR